MKKLYLNILWPLLFIVFVTPVFAFSAATMEKDAKEAFVKRDLAKVTEIASIWKEQIKTTPVPYFLLIYAYYAKGDYQKIPKLLNAIDTQDKKEFLLIWAEKFARQYPQNPIPYLLKGDAYIRLKKYNEAIKEFNIAEEFAPRLFLVYAAKGMFYTFENRYDLAIKNFSQAIKLEPNSADIYNDRGIVYYCQGDYLSALSDFNQAIKIDPKFTLAYLGRGKVYRCLGKDDLAADDFKKVREINQEGFALSSKATKDPLTGKIMRQFDLNVETSPSKVEIKLPLLKKSLVDGSLGSLKGIDSKPEGEIIKVEEGVLSEKVWDGQFIIPALSFLLYNDQFFFGAERGK
jgi:tetratricopeptide (TPR) repeat protein